MGYIKRNRNTEFSCDNSLHQRRFKTTLSFLRQAGLLINNTSPSKVQTLCAIVGAVCYYFTWMCAIMDTYVHRYDLTKAMEKFRLWLIMSCMIWMNFTCSYRKRDIELLLRLTDSFTWEELPTRDPDTGYLTKAGYIPIIQRINKHTFWIFLLLHFIQSTFRIVISRELIMSAWFPFDISATSVYICANIIQRCILLHCILASGLSATGRKHVKILQESFQHLYNYTEIQIARMCSIKKVIASFFAALLGFSIPSLYATLMIVPCSQLEKVRAALLDIRQAQDNYHHHSGRHTDISEHVFQHMRKQLDDCICHHQNILRYTEILEDTMNLPLCGLFLMYFSSMCFDALFIMMSLSNVADVLQGVGTYIYLTLSLGLYCWLGNELSTEVEMVRDAAWGCDWIGTPVPFQRSLVFIIAKANKGFTLTAGKFVPVSNNTMLNMVKESLSFFMFLLYVKDKNTQNTQQG